MALTDVAVCAQALVLLGEQPISGFDDGTDAAVTCDEVYRGGGDGEPGLRKHLLTVYPWKFTNKYAQLSLDATPPVMEWEFRFILPPDMMNGPLEVKPSELARAMDVGQYEIFPGYLHANINVAWAQYQVDKPESTWPQFFVQFAIAALAAALAIPITGAESLETKFHKRAWGRENENQQGGLFGTAKRTDSRRDPPSRFSRFSLVDVRHQGVGH